MTVIPYVPFRVPLASSAGGAADGAASGRAAPSSVSFSAWICVRFP